MNLLFYTQDDQIMTQFYSDIVSSAIFANYSSFVLNYPQNLLDNYSIILFCQRFVKKSVEQAFKVNAQKLGQIKQQVHNQMQKMQSESKNDDEIPQQKAMKIVNALSNCLLSRLQEIKAVHLIQSISLGSAYLKDVNWKITKTISSNSRSFSGPKYPHLFNLTLYVKGKHTSSEDFLQQSQNWQEISVELNKIQLKQFLAQLKNIKTDIS